MNTLAQQTDQQWRELVFPANYRNPQPAAAYNLIVIGAGPAGLVTAIAAAGLGAKVALIERQAMGGDCLNVGCVPSKTLLAAAARGLPFAAAMQRVREVRAAIAQHDSVARYTAAGVDVFLGAARFVGKRAVQVAGVELTARKIVIATGARAAMPPIAGLTDLQPRTNEDIFELQAMPARLTVLGGGPIGCELAQAFARLGSAVTIVEQASRLLPNEEADAAEGLTQALQRERVQVLTGQGVTQAAMRSGSRVLTLTDGRTIECDEILVAAGRRRNLEELGLEAAGVRFDARHGIEVDAQLRTTNRHVYAAGDVCSRYQFTHSADAMARIVIRNALFMGRARVDRLIIPWCTYTQPEIAHVGETRQSLAAAGRPYQALRCNFADLDRGRTDDGGDGYAEVLLADGTDRILGATVVGKDAGEQLSSLVVLMSTGQGLGALSSLVLPYPTRSEYLRRLADAWNRSRLTPRTAATLRWWLSRIR